MKEYKKRLICLNIMDINLNNLHKIESFTILFQNLKLFSDNINIDCNEERIYIQTMDNLKISIIEINIPSTWFCYYSCPIPVVLGINSNIFSKILSSREKQQTMQIVYNNEQEDKLFFHMSCDIKTVFDRDFEIPLINLETDLMVIPPIEYQADISLPSSDFALIINQLRGFGEILEIICNEEKIEMITKSIEQGKMSVLVNIDDVSGFAIEESCELNMSFSLNILSLICSFSKLSKEIDIKMHKEYPLYISFHNEELYVKHYLAPRINDEN
jgi:proliferating cell nuclear antigen